MRLNNLQLQYVPSQHPRVSIRSGDIPFEIGVEKADTEFFFSRQMPPKEVFHVDVG